jgi:hypothetical protein
VCLAVAQVLLRYDDERHWLRAAASRVGHLFPRLLGQSEYNDRVKAAAPLMESALRWLAEATPGSAEMLRLMKDEKEPRYFPNWLRQRVEAIIWTLKNQLGLERHGGRVPAGLWARIVQRLLATQRVRGAALLRPPGAVRSLRPSPPISRHPRCGAVASVGRGTAEGTPSHRPAGG